MDDDAKLRLTLRLVPADVQPADAVVFDDIIRLLQQGILTAPKEVPAVTVPADGFRAPNDDEQRSLRSLEAKIEARIQEASAASEAAITKRAATAAQPDGAAKLSADALKAAEAIVSAVGRAALRGVFVGVADHNARTAASPPSSTSP